MRKSHPAARPYSDRCGRRPLDELPGIGAELLPGFCFRVELHGLCVFIAFANARRCIVQNVIQRAPERPYCPLHLRIHGVVLVGRWP